MQLPRNEMERNKLVSAIRALKGNDYFDTVLTWFKSELQQRDIENRIKGMENTTSEAQALNDFLKYVAACQAPEVDRDQSLSGAESTSASSLM